MRDKTNCNYVTIVSIISDAMIFLHTEIIDKVRTGEELPFRPRIGDLAEKYPKYVTDLLKDAWHENAELRPNFKAIRTRLRPLQKGM